MHYMGCPLRWEALSASVALNGAAASLAVAALGLMAGWPAGGSLIAGNGAGIASFALLDVDSADPYDPMDEPCPDAGPAGASRRARIRPVRADQSFTPDTDFGSDPVICVLVGPDGTAARAFVVSSTGDPALDDALLASAMRLPWARPRQSGWVRVVMDRR